MTRPGRWAAGALALLLLGGCADGEREAISPEARALIAEGDAAMDRAGRLRAAARALEPAIEGEGDGSGPPQDGGMRRRGLPSAPEGGVPAGDPPADGASLEARRDAADREAERLEREAVERWRRAAAIDADAQDAILRRLRGSVPES